MDSYTMPLFSMLESCCALSREKFEAGSLRSHADRNPWLQVRALVVSVLPFDRVGFKNPHNVPKYAEKGLKTLEACADTLLSELRIESVATGLNVRVEVSLSLLQLAKCT